LTLHARTCRLAIRMAARHAPFRSDGRGSWLRVGLPSEERRGVALNRRIVNTARERPVLVVAGATGKTFGNVSRCRRSHLMTTVAASCMKCGGRMRPYERSGLMIDQCEDCRGMFLDQGELERLIEAEGGGWSGMVGPPTALPIPRPCSGLGPEGRRRRDASLQPPGSHGHERQRGSTEAMAVRPTASRNGTPS
jgi:Zn-finger nucleic acid-binding protein